MHLPFITSLVGLVLRLACLVFRFWVCPFGDCRVITGFSRTRLRALHGATAVRDFCIDLPIFCVFPIHAAPLLLCWVLEESVQSLHGTGPRLCIPLPPSPSLLFLFQLRQFYESRPFLADIDNVPLGYEPPIPGPTALSARLELNGTDISVDAPDARVLLASDYASFCQCDIPGDSPGGSLAPSDTLRSKPGGLWLAADPPVRDPAAYKRHLTSLDSVVLVMSLDDIMLVPPQCLCARCAHARAKYGITQADCFVASSPPNRSAQRTPRSPS